jgi:hypothetical protein
MEGSMKRVLFDETETLIFKKYKTNEPTPLDPPSTLEVENSNDSITVVGTPSPPKIEPKTRVVRLKRRKGKIIQDCDVYIGRKFTMSGWNLHQSKWYNPFTIQDYGSAEAAVSRYRQYILGEQDLLDSLHELDGQVLGCWCKPMPCHGDVLIQLLQERQCNKK